ncbi:MAG: hypothetical protein SOU51_04030 [Collinsella sp.]|nr:hypothetical protein [Collinsella sp.]
MSAPFASDSFKAGSRRDVEPVIAREPHSAYWGLDAQASAAAYMKRLHAIKGKMIGLIVSIGALGVAAAGNGIFVLWFGCLVAIGILAMRSRARIGSLFLGLMGIVSDDCDVGRYRQVMEILRQRDRLGRSAQVIQVELAYCDYLELSPSSALERLEGISFRRKNNPGWYYRSLQVEFLSLLDLGDRAAARDAMERLSTFKDSLGKGSRNRALAEAQLVDFALILRTPAERDEGDARYMRDAMLRSEDHQRRVRWQLLLAEYEMLHGSRDEARRLAGDPSLLPLTPRGERLRASILEGLGL